MRTTGHIARVLARLTAVLGLTMAAVGVSATGADADPWAMGQCTTSSGAVLAVDFSHWGGPVYRACGSTPTTGYELLNQGGWRTTGTGHDGPAFICRIGFSGYKSGKQFPPASQDDCVLTPPASAYWSYWHANPGDNDWEYSQLGAMLYKPRPGSVDLWIFGGTDIEGTKGRPTVTPDQLRAHNTRPSGAGRPASTAKAPALPPNVDTGPAPEQPVERQSTTPSPAAGPTKKPKADKPPERSESPSPTPTPTASPSPSSVVAANGRKTRVINAEPTADAPHDTGSVLPLVAGGALVLLIGGAAWYSARRRPHE